MSNCISLHFTADAEADRDTLGQRRPPSCSSSLTMSLWRAAALFHWTHTWSKTHSFSLSLSPSLPLSLPLSPSLNKSCQRKKRSCVGRKLRGGGGDARSCCRHILLVTTDSGRSGARIGLKLSVRVGRPQDLIENEEICLGESTCFSLIRQRHFSLLCFLAFSSPRSCLDPRTVCAWFKNVALRWDRVTEHSVKTPPAQAQSEYSVSPILLTRALF